MTNMCQNILFVDAEESLASKHDVHNFRHYLVNTNPLANFFTKLKPPPKKLMRKYNAYYDLYIKQNMQGIHTNIENIPNYASILSDWRKKNWGIREDIDFEDIHIKEWNMPMSINFNTQWSPPIEGIQILSKKFPHAIFDLRYAEMGVNFCGQIIYKNGRKVKKQHYSPCEKTIHFLLGFD